MNTLPPGCTPRDIDGDTALKLYTVDVRVRVYVTARDDDGACVEAEQAVLVADNISVIESEVFDSEPA